MAAWDSVWPVSYTHLDVYKRQAQDQYPGLPVLCSGGVASNRHLRHVLTEFCQAIFAQPVSYTHLDVYKRQ